MLEYMQNNLEKIASKEDNFFGHIYAIFLLAEFRLGNKEKATKIIEDYLKVKEKWAWGYIEMADWYLDNSEQYDLLKAKEILLRADEVKNIDDRSAVFDRLREVYDRLGEQETAKEYEEKCYEIENENIAKIRKNTNRLIKEITELLLSKYKSN